MYGTIDVEPTAVGHLTASGMIRRAGWRRVVTGAVGILAVYASTEPAIGQQPAICPDGRIAEVVIENHSVFDMSDPNRGGRFAWAYRLANGLHVRTRGEVIERELLFEAGDCYDLDILRDSERLLRAFAFLADANIYGIRQTDGTVQVRVDTQDEWSTRVEPRVASGDDVGLTGIRLVEDNLVGTGQHLGLFYDRENGEVVYGASYSTPHLFQTRWNLDARIARTEVGHSYYESASYPFVGELGRVAFRQAIDRQDRYFELLMPRSDDELSRIWVPVSREQFEIGGAFRWGRERYRHTLIGAALAGERIRYPSEATFAYGEKADSSRNAELRLPMVWQPVSSLRLMLLTGQRNVYYVRRHAFDTVNGTEDIQLGVEAEGSFGPTLPVISDDRDIAVGLGLLAAGELAGRVVVGGNFSFEGRRSYEKIEGLPEWHDILAELDLWAYARRSPESRHLWVIAASALGGWHSRVPFQLTLGGEAGLRGYPRHVHPGGRRMVASIEHRAYIGWPLPELLDLGTVTFFDIGRIWPGHAPFGDHSAVRASVGAGIRAAFPPGSRQTFRLDVGFPLERGGGLRNVTVTVGVGQAIGRSTVRRDPQLLRSARYGISGSDFGYDNLP